MLFEGRLSLVKNVYCEPQDKCLVVIDTQRKDIKWYHIICAIKTKACIKRGKGSGIK